MLNIHKMLEITAANQDLFMDLNKEDAEAISGGYEVFEIKNQTKYDIYYTVDGEGPTYLARQPGGSEIWFADKGIIKFKVSGFPKKIYDLEYGRVYAFRPVGKRKGTIDLYDVGALW